MIGGVSEELGDSLPSLAVAAHGNRCSCTLANLKQTISCKVLEKKTVKKDNLFNVTSVPVSFLQRLRALSNRSGSSFKNFSSRTTFSISVLRKDFMPSCRLGNLKKKDRDLQNQ